MIPRGLPVGTAVKGLDGVWRVRLDADESSIDFVRILLFKDFSLLANQQELAQPGAPSAPPPPEAASPATHPVPTPAAKKVTVPAASGAVSVGAARPAPAPPPLPTVKAPPTDAAVTAAPSDKDQ
jgi:rod shape-determining protein MreC